MAYISIRGARADCRLTQREVANHLGLSVPTYAEIERNPTRITWEQANKLAELFDRPITDFAFSAPVGQESQMTEEVSLSGVGHEGQA